MIEQDKIKVIWECISDEYAKERLSQVFDLIFSKLERLDDKKNQNGKKQYLTNQRIYNKVKGKL